MRSIAVLPVLTNSDNLAAVRTPEMLRLFLVRQNEKGRLKPQKLAQHLGYTEKSSMLSQILSGKRGFPMDMLDEIAAFFDYRYPEDFIRDVRTRAANAPESPNEAKEPSPARPATERFRKKRKARGRSLLRASRGSTRVPKRTQHQQGTT
jgi:hypothetical protein